MYGINIITAIGDVYKYANYNILLYRYAHEITLLPCTCMNLILLLLHIIIMYYSRATDGL